MKNLVLTSILLLPLLTGCIVTAPKMPDAPVLVSEEIIVIDSELLESCKDLPKLDSAATLNSILLEHYPGTIEMYGECANKQNASIKALKRLANIK